MSEVGRPTDYSPELADRICAELGKGRSLKRICADDWAPSTTAVYEWIQIHREFADKYARAREVQAETMADELIDLSDLAEDVQKARLQIDTRKWVAAKLLPKKYGERQQIEHSTDPDKPLEILVRNAEELRAKIRGT